ncbi:hypothetical protein THAOC_02759, partial [Thalassiosira oceanica]
MTGSPVALALSSPRLTYRAFYLVISLRQAQELHGLLPRQVLQRGLPEGPPQAAQEGLQAAHSRARGRAVVQPGSREAGRGLLPNLRTTDFVTNGRAFSCNDADTLAMVRARVEKKDPEAINDLGQKLCLGQLGLLEEIGKAFELWTEVAELGSGSVDIIKRMSMGGLAIKEQNTEDLKGYGDAVEEMKSPDRDKAKRLGR